MYTFFLAVFLSTPYFSSLPMVFISWVGSPARSVAASSPSASLRAAAGRCRSSERGAEGVGEGNEDPEKCQPGAHSMGKERLSAS